MYERHAASDLKEALGAEPVVLITGPRQSGKTTLAQMVGEPQGYAYYSLDDPDVFRLAQRNPKGFIGSGPVILDEVQRLPEMLRILKVAVDRNRRPGRFLLTGSANILQMPETGESLAGRMRTVRLHPLSQSEIEGKSQSELERNPPLFLDRLFDADFEILKAEVRDPFSSPVDPDIADRSITARIVAGGYPVALAHTTVANRTVWYRDYATALIERDAVELAKVRNAEVLANLLQVMADHTAEQLKASRLAHALGVDRRTVRDYICLLERMFLLKSLPAWYHDSLQQTVSKAPKRHFGDTGLACALLGVDTAALNRDPTRRDLMLETFVLQELRRQDCASRHQFFHYRSNNRQEVDIVIQRSANAFVGVEVKSAATMRPEFFKGLESMRDALGDKFVCGVVLYEGELCAPWGDRLFSVPIQMLWETMT